MAQTSNRTSTLVVVGIVVAALVIGWFAMPKGTSDTAQQTAQAVAGPRVGAAAPDFTATAVDGSTVSLAQLRGKNVWLSFGGTWCAGCRSEAPDLKAVQGLAAEQGVVIVAFYLDEHDPAVKEFSSMMGLTFSQVADPQRVVGEKYQSNSVPVHYFIDKSGVITKVHQGVLTAAQMEEQIRTMSGSR
ncbi:MAG: TlpA family protein disulfide reductase [Propionibacteriaceae bacterium]